MLNDPNKSLKIEKYRCTICRDDFDKVTEHPFLKVIVCYTCEKEFNRLLNSTNGQKFCQWCGLNTDLIDCIKCHKSICRNCLCINLPSEYFENIDEDDNVCLICNNGPIKDFQDKCSEVIGSTEEASEFRSQQTPSKININISSPVIDVEDSDVEEYPPKSTNKITKVDALNTHSNPLENMENVNNCLSNMKLDLKNTSLMQEIESIKPEDLPVLINAYKKCILHFTSDIAQFESLLIQHASLNDANILNELAKLFQTIICHHLYNRCSHPSDRIQEEINMKQILSKNLKQLEYVPDENRCLQTNQLVSNSFSPMLMDRDAQVQANVTEIMKAFAKEASATSTAINIPDEKRKRNDSFKVPNVTTRKSSRRSAALEQETVSKIAKTSEILPKSDLDESKSNNSRYKSASVKFKDDLECDDDEIEYIEEMDDDEDDDDWSAEMESKKCGRRASAQSRRKSKKFNKYSTNKKRGPDNEISTNRESKIPRKDVSIVNASNQIDLTIQRKPSYNANERTVSRFKSLPSNIQTANGTTILLPKTSNNTFTHLNASSSSPSIRTYNIRQVSLPGNAPRNICIQNALQLPQGIRFKQLQPGNIPIKICDFVNTNFRSHPVNRYNIRPTTSGNLVTASQIIQDTHVNNPTTSTSSSQNLIRPRTVNLITESVVINGSSAKTENNKLNSP